MSKKVALCLILESRLCDCPKKSSFFFYSKFFSFQISSSPRLKKRKKTVNFTVFCLKDSLFILLYHFASNQE